MQTVFDPGFFQLCEMILRKWRLSVIYVSCGIAERHQAGRKNRTL